MAVTAIWDVKDELDSVIRYVAKSSKTWRGQYDRAAEYHALENVLQYTADQMKTEKQFYVSGINCEENPDQAKKQFEETKRNWEKEGGIVCFHGYQSFAPGEVTPEVAHAIGIELAKRLWGDRFEVLVTTHLNTKAVHNHFCLNSVSFADGLRYYDQKATYKKMREVSDALCREWGLSVIEPKGRGRHIGEIKDEESGKLTMRGQIKADIDQAVKENYSWRTFCTALGELGYVTEWRGSFFRIRPDQGKKFFRFDRLGEGYSVEDIRRRLNENYYQLHRQEEEPFVLPKRDRAKGLYALFLHYQYLLGHLPKSRPPNDPEAYAQMKADRKKLQQYSDAAKLLGKYQIFTAEQLRDHTEKISEQFQSLAIQRKKFQNRLRHLHDSERMQPIKEQIAALTERMAELRKEMRICTNVAECCRGGDCKSDRASNPRTSRKTTREKGERRKMNTGGESAELLMKMMLNGSEVLIRLTGSGAKNVAVLLYSVLREQNKTKGAERLSNMLRSGKKLRVYTFQDKDLQKFKEVAKQYGILYTVLKDKDHTGGVFDVLVRAEDEHKLARVIERFEFTHVDTASLRAEILKEKEEREAAQKKEPAEKKEEPKEQATEEKETAPEEPSAQSPEDKAADELMAGAKKREEAKANPSEARSDESMSHSAESKELEREEPSKDTSKTPDAQTPTDREFLSEPLSETPNEKSESHRNYHPKRKQSVRKKIEQIKRERAREAQNAPMVPTQQKAPTTKER